MRRHHTAWLIVGLLGLGLSLPAIAQDPNKGLEQLAERARLLKSIEWQKGPGTGMLGNVAQITIPERHVFTGEQGAHTWEEATQNPYSPNTRGILQPEGEGWVLIFSFSDIGYVKDDEKLDANAILEGLKKGAEEGNKERRRKGWPTLSVVGWEYPPAYDQETHNLVWAIRGQDDASGSPIVNYETRLLGRGGVMSATLICDPDELAATVPTVKKLLEGFSYVPGQKYSEWKAGDKIAAVGLSALIGGGAVALAAKSGLLGKLIKPLIIGAIAIVGAIGALLKRIFGSRQEAS